MKNKKMAIGTMLLLFAISGICNMSTISNAWIGVFYLDPSHYKYYDLGYLHEGSIIHINEISADKIITAYIMNDEDFDEIGGFTWDYIIRWQDKTLISNYHYYITTYDKYYIVIRNVDIFDGRSGSVNIDVEKADIIITSPIYYETFTIGYNDITWTSTGSIDYVKIDLYSDGVFLETINSGTFNDGSYSWYIYGDEYIDDDWYQIKISNFYDNSVYDYTGYFTIESEIKSITITLPTSYTTIQSGYNDITWTSTGSIDYVKIELYRNYVFLETIDSYEYNDGIYSWYIYDDDYTDDSNYEIKISDYDDNYIYDYSSYFTIECEIDVPDDPDDPDYPDYPIIPSFNLLIIIGLIGSISVISAIIIRRRINKIKPKI